MNKDVFKINFKQITEYIKKYKGFGFLTKPAKDNLERKSGTENANISNLQNTSEDLSTAQANVTPQQNLSATIGQTAPPTNVSEHPIPLTITPNIQVDFSKYIPKEYKGDGGTDKLINRLDVLLDILRNESREEFKVIIEAVNRVIAGFKDSATVISQLSEINKQNLTRINLQRQEMADRTTQNTNALNENNTILNDNKTILAAIKDEISAAVREMRTRNQTLEPIRRSSVNENDLSDMTIDTFVAPAPQYITELNQMLSNLKDSIQNFRPLTEAQIDIIIQRNNNFITSSNNFNYQQQINQTLNQINLIFTQFKTDLPKNLNVTATLDAEQPKQELQKIVSEITNLSEALKTFKDNLPRGPGPGDGGSPAAAIAVNINYDEFFEKLMSNPRILEFFQPKIISPISVEEATKIMTVFNKLSSTLDNLSDSDKTTKSDLVNIAESMKQISENTKLNLDKIVVDQNTNTSEVKKLIVAISTSTSQVSGIKTLLDNLKLVNALDAETVDNIKALVSRTPDTTTTDKTLNSIYSEMSGIRLDRNALSNLIDRMGAISESGTNTIKQLIDQLNADDSVKKSLLDELSKKERPITITPNVEPISKSLKDIYDLLLTINQAIVEPSPANLQALQNTNTQNIPEAQNVVNAIVNTNMAIDPERVIIVNNDQNEDNENELNQTVVEARDPDNTNYYATATVPPDQVLPLNTGPPDQVLPLNQIDAPPEATEVIAQEVMEANSGYSQFSTNNNQSLKKAEEEYNKKFNSKNTKYLSTEDKLPFRVMEHKGREYKGTLTSLNPYRDQWRAKRDQLKDAVANAKTVQQEKNTVQQEKNRAFEQSNAMAKISSTLSDFYNKHKYLVEIHSNIILSLRELDEKQFQAQSRYQPVSGNNNVSAGGDLDAYIKAYNGHFNSTLNAGQIRARLSNQSNIIGTILSRQTGFLQLVQNNNRANKKVIHEIAARLVAATDNHLFNTDYDRFISDKCPNCNDIYSDNNKRLQLACGDSICNACNHIFGNKCMVNFDHNSTVNSAAEPTVEVKKAFAIKDNKSGLILSAPENLFTALETKLGKKNIKQTASQYLKNACEDIQSLVSEFKDQPHDLSLDLNSSNERALRYLANTRNIREYMEIIILGLPIKERYKIIEHCKTIILAVNSRRVNPETFNFSYDCLFGTQNSVPDELNPFITCLQKRIENITGNKIDDNILATYAEGYLTLLRQRKEDLKADKIYNIPLISTVLPTNIQSGVKTEDYNEIKQSGETNACGYCTLVFKDSWYTVSHKDKTSCNVCVDHALETGEKCLQCDKFVIKLTRQWNGAIVERAKGKNEFELQNRLSSTITSEQKLYDQKIDFETNFPDQLVPENLSTMQNPWVNEKFSSDIYNVKAQLAATEDVSKESVGKAKPLPLPKPGYEKSELLLKNNPDNIINDNLVPKLTSTLPSGVDSIKQALAVPAPSKEIPMDYSKALIKNLIVDSVYNPVLSPQETANQLVMNKGHIFTPSEVKDINQYPPQIVPLFQDEEEEESVYESLNNYIKIVENNVENKSKYGAYENYASRAPISNEATGEGIEKDEMNDVSENKNERHFNMLNRRFANIPISKRFDHISEIAKQDISNHNVVAKGILSNYVKKNDYDRRDGDLNFNSEILNVKPKNLNRSPKPQIKIPNCDHCDQNLYNRQFHVYKNQDTDPIKGGVICASCFDTKKMLPNSRKMIDKTAYEPAYESTTNTAKGIIKNIHKKIIEPFYEISESPKNLWDAFKDSIPIKYNVNNVIDKLLKDILLTSEQVTDLILDYYIIALAYNTFTDHSTDVLKANIFSISSMYAKQQGVEYLKLYRVAFTKFQTFENLKNYIIDYPNIVLQLIPHNG